MAWASVGRAGSTGNQTLNSTILTITLNGQAGTGASVGDLLVWSIGVQSATTVTADEGAVLSVEDTVGNTWTKIRELTNGRQTVGSTGVVCSLWYTHVTQAASTTDTVSCIFGSSAARDAQGGIVWRFSKSGSASVRVADSTFLTSSTSLPGVMDLATPASEFLRYRTWAARTTIQAFSTTAGWTTIGTTRSGAAAPSEAIYGEYLITSATTAQSAPVITGAGSPLSVSHYVVFEENLLMGDSEL
jgi:hypothetical protein